MAVVRWGVIGAGGIARRRTIPEGILPAANAELVAVHSVPDGEAVANEFGVHNCATEEVLLASDIDAVYIATPTYLHHDQVIQAATAGKHVLCEKPLSTDVESASEMVAACQVAGVKLGVGLMMRYHAKHLEAMRLVREGAIGKPVFGRAQLSCWYPPIKGAWRQDPALGGGGALADLGVHCIDLLEMFLGKVTRVSSMTSNRVHDYPAEDTAVVLLEFDSGAYGIVDCLFNVPDVSSLNRLELYGSCGSLLAEQTIGQGGPGVMIRRTTDSSGGYDAKQQRGDGTGMSVEPTHTNVYLEQIERFSQAILDDSQPPVTGDAGLWSQRVLAACYESSMSGRVQVLEKSAITVS